MIAVILLLQAFAAKGVVGLCGVISNSRTIREELICGKHGSIGRNPINRQFNSPSFAACAEYAYRDDYGRAFSFNSSDNTCTTYVDYPRPRFRQNPRSDTKIYAARCFLLAEPCYGVVANPSFEEHFTGIPERNGSAVQQVSYNPWVVENQIEDTMPNITSISYLGSNNDVPYGGDPTPFGSKFLVIEVDSHYYSTFRQVAKLKPRTKYRIEAFYNFFHYDGEPSLPHGPTNEYWISFLFYAYIGRVNLKPDKGDANGKWKHFEATFTNPPLGQARTKGVAVVIVPPYKQPYLARRAVFGFDSITLTELAD